MSEKLIIVPTAQLLPVYGIDYCDSRRRILEADGTFPRRVFLSQKKYGYVKAEIEAYLAKRIAMRDSAEARAKAAERSAFGAAISARRVNPGRPRKDGKPKKHSGAHRKAG